MKNSPIGIFDSGVGGTSIWKEICTLLPNEDTIYLADSKNAPYGPKGKDSIINLSIKNTLYSFPFIHTYLYLITYNIYIQAENTFFDPRKICIQT